MAIHVIDPQQKVRMGFIELLNDLGLNVIHIDNTYYVFTDFVEYDPQGAINEISMIGKNITSIVENTTQTIGADKLRQREILDHIDVMSNRRRVFSPATPYRKYLYNG